MRNAILVLALALLIPAASVQARERCEIVHGAVGAGERVCAPTHVIRWCSHKKQDWTRYRCVSDALERYDAVRADFIADNPSLPAKKIWAEAVERAAPKGIKKLERCAKRLVRWVEKGVGKPQPRC